jgi:hypothetical protein
VVLFGGSVGIVEQTEDELIAELTGTWRVWTHDPSACALGPFFIRGLTAFEGDLEYAYPEKSTLVMSGPEGTSIFAWKPLSRPASEFELAAIARVQKTKSKRMSLDRENAHKRLDLWLDAVESVGPDPESGEHMAITFDVDVRGCGTGNIWEGVLSVTTERTEIGI